MNQQCKVCGEPAAGFHFGAFTCEGCKSFFGRTYNNLSSISECKNNDQCVINKKNRTACKACRLRKCLLVGMSKSGSRYGRRSNWFKIHCLLQEQQQQQQAAQAQQQANNNNNLSSPNNMVAAAAAAAAASLMRPHPYLPLFGHHPHSFMGLPPSSMNLPPMTSSREPRSSESDSGASSADLEDEVRSTGAMSCLKLSSASPVSDRDYFSGGSSKKLPSPASDSECTRRKLNNIFTQFAPASPASLPAISPGVVPRWLPPFPGIGDPALWRDLWPKSIPLPTTPVAPLVENHSNHNHSNNQEQPIDLSRKPTTNTRSATATATTILLDNDQDDLNIDVGVDEQPQVQVKSAPLDLTLERPQDVVSN